MSNGQWKTVPVEPTPEIIAAAALAVWPVASAKDIDVARRAAKIVLLSMDVAPGTTLESLSASLATMAPAYRAMLAAAPDAPSAEPVAWRLIDGDDCEYNTVDRFSCGRSGGEPLYATPPDAAAEIARLRGLIDEQKGTIRALNMALAGEDSTSTENLIAAHELDPGCAGLISLCMELRAEVEPYQLLEQQLAAQSAALAKAKEALEGVCDSDEECQDSDGWTAAVISLEALHEAQEALETIAQFDGAQAEGHAHPASDADNAIYQSIARNYTAQAGEEGKRLTMSNECNQKKDADRFNFLQNIPAEQAQAFFWNYQSRHQRAKAIDAAMLAAQELSHD